MSASYQILPLAMHAFHSMLYDHPGASGFRLRLWQSQGETPEQIGSLFEHSSPRLFYFVDPCTLIVRDIEGNAMSEEILAISRDTLVAVSGWHNIAAKADHKVLVIEESLGTQWEHERGAYLA